MEQLSPKIQNLNITAQPSNSSPIFFNNSDDGYNTLLNTSGHTSGISSGRTSNTSTPPSHHAAKEATSSNTSSTHHPIDNTPVLTLPKNLFKNRKNLVKFKNHKKLKKKLKLNNCSLFSDLSTCHQSTPDFADHSQLKPRDEKSISSSSTNSSNFTSGHESLDKFHTPIRKKRDRGLKRAPPPIIEDNSETDSDSSSSCTSQEFKKVKLSPTTQQDIEDFLQHKIHLSNIKNTNPKTPPGSPISPKKQLFIDPNIDFVKQVNAIKFDKVYKLNDFNQFLTDLKKICLPEPEYFFVKNNRKDHRFTPIRPTRPTSKNEPKKIIPKTNFEANYVIDDLPHKSSCALIWTGRRKMDNLPVVAKQIPKSKIHRWANFNDHYIPYEFMSSFVVQQLSKFKAENEIDLNEAFIVDDYSDSNIVQNIEFFERENSFILVMERREESLDLLEYLNLRQKPLSETSAKFVFKQILNALKNCHEAGFYHRDLKDENIVIDPSTYLIKLIDFGCATSINEEPYQDIAGTPQFSSPEWWKCRIAQRRLEKEKNNSNLELSKLSNTRKLSDIKNDEKLSSLEIEKLSSYKWLGSTCEAWNLGIILYTMLHIKLPFNNHREICQLDIRNKLGDHLSLECKNLIKKLLIKNYADRIKFDDIFNDSWLEEK